MSISRFPLVLLVLPCAWPTANGDSPPNIFIAISDDQSWQHASAYGSKMVQSPNFDRIAQQGVLFTQAFAASPGCSPSRAALLTGRNTWQIEHAGTHASYFDPKYETFVDRLANAGYFVGHTGKGWGPGDFKKLGRKHNPAGPSFDARGGYADAFEQFLQQRPQGKPFCFWFGSTDPHRSYKKGSGLEKGKHLADADVPTFLPDKPEIRSDLLDYAFEVERFDSDLGKMIALLEQANELDKTLIIVTSDNGMPFPRAKANCYEYGIHVPLAIRWGKESAARRVVDDLIGFTDLTATIYDVAGVDPPSRFPIVGRSIAGLLKSEKSGIVERSRTAVYAARERHSSSRYNSLGYPQRCIRTHQFLYIQNLTPERWPAGPADKFTKAVYGDDGVLLHGQLGPPHNAYHDIDACPTLTYLVQHRAEREVKFFLDLSVERRPDEELFDVEQDPGCLRNLARQPQWADVKTDLAARLVDYLKRTGDPRVTGDGEVWETYPRVSSLRWFPKPQWAEDSLQSPPRQDWLELRRPKK